MIPYLARLASPFRCSAASAALQGRRRQWIGPRTASTKGIVMLLRWLAALFFVDGLAVGFGADMTATPSLISAEES
jgi:hypothetical protein